MGIQAKGEITVDVDRQTAFRIVGDPLRMAQCIPGCGQLREISPGHFSAVLTNQVAFITIGFDVFVDVIRIEQPTAIEARIAGDSRVLASRVSATAGVWLDEAGEHSTTIRYAASIALTGKLGGLGEPVLRAKSAEVAREFGSNLRAAIEKDRGQHE